MKLRSLRSRGWHTRTHAHTPHTRSWKLACSALPSWDFEPFPRLHLCPMQSKCSVLWDVLFSLCPIGSYLVQVLGPLRVNSWGRVRGRVRSW